MILMQANSFLGPYKQESDLSRASHAQLMLIGIAYVYNRSENLNRVVRASDCQCHSRTSPRFNVFFQSQHPLTQWNLGDGRWSSVDF